MEFDLIQFIKTHVENDASVVLGIGDDAAVVSVSDNHQLVVSTDTLVYGKHFDETITAVQLGHKSLAVNLSDLAAMGATPKWLTLNLTLPKIDMHWVEGFVQGLIKLANRYAVKLIGGDTTQGPLSITVTVFGEVAKDQFLTRNKAQRGDLIAVTGEIGSAAYALHNHKSKLADALFTPHPQLEISQSIKHFAHSCIDISDGLLADLGHICNQSLVGAKISLEQIPVHPIVKKDNPQWMNQVLSGGDDYQLCFTFSSKDLDKLPDNCTIIGQMGCGSTVKVFRDNQEIEVSNKGFIHFSTVNSV
jgi:thiamine-monophosphate kinase